MAAAAGGAAPALEQWLNSISSHSSFGAVLRKLHEYGAGSVEDLLILEPNHVQDLCSGLPVIPAKKLRDAIQSLPQQQLGAGGPAEPLAPGGAAPGPPQSSPRGGAGPAEDYQICVRARYDQCLRDEGPEGTLSAPSRGG
jgi:hypothetical protein